MIRSLVYLTGMVTIALVAVVAAVAYRVHEWPWGDYFRSGRRALAETLDPGEGARDRPLGTGRRSSPEARPEGGTWRWEPSEVRRHRIRRGDTLYAIARDYYGDPMLWRRIARVNGIKRREDVTVGRVLVIPDLEAREAAPDDGRTSRAPGPVERRWPSLRLALTPAFEPGPAPAGREEDRR